MQSSFASTSSAVRAYPAGEDPCDVCLLSCPSCSPQAIEPCCPLPFLSNGHPGAPLSPFPSYFNDCQACAPHHGGTGGGGESPGGGGGGGNNLKSHLAFCCDDEGCVETNSTATSVKGKEVNRGIGFEGGGASLSGSGPRSWEQMMLDDCAQCVDHGQQGASTNGLGLVDSSCCSTPWLEGEESMMDAFTDCRTAGCFDLPSPSTLPTDTSHASGSSTDSLSTLATSNGEAKGHEGNSVDLDGLLDGLDESTIQDILNCCCCEEVLHDQPSTFDPSTHTTHQQLPQHIHCDEQHGPSSQPHYFPHLHLPRQPSLYPSQPISNQPTSLPVLHTCGWNGCQLNFNTAEELVLHVNTVHLALPPASNFGSLPTTSLPLTNSSLSQPPILPTNFALPGNGQDSAANALKQVSLGQLSQLDPATALAIFSSIFADRSSLPQSLPTTSMDLPLPPPLPTSVPTHPKPTVHSHHRHQHSHSHSNRNSRRHVHSHPYGVASIRRPSTTSSSAPQTPSIAGSSNFQPISSMPTPASQFATSPSHSFPTSTVASPIPQLSAPCSIVPPSPSSTTHVCRWRSCGMSFATSADLMEHLSTDHIGSGKARYTCEWDGCDRSTQACEERGDDEEEKDKKAFRQRQKVMRHLQMHTGDRPFTCKVCGKTFSESLTLTQHMRVHTQERPYACDHPGCGKTFALASALTIHKRTHTGDRPFVCPHPDCNAAFAESSNLSKHIKTHTNARHYVCQVEGCGKAFGRSDQLKRHGKVHNKTKKKNNGDDELD